MKPLSFAGYLTLLGFASIANGQSTTEKAIFNFTQYAKGYVSIMNGHIGVELDLSDIDLENASLPTDCYDGGVWYHIHTEWNHADDTDKVGSTDCGEANTGLHFDPWFACSTNSDSDDCRDNGGCVWPSSIIEVNGTYDCSSDTFDTHPYACEVADFTGKYGVASVSNNYISDWSSNWIEMNPEDLGTDYSIVFHCNDGTRAFCAPFTTVDVATSVDDLSNDEMRLTGDDEARINFNDLTAEGVSFSGTEVTLKQGSVNVEIPSSVASACDDWLIYIYSDWYHSSSNSKYNDDCNNSYIGYVWDPTHSCINSGDHVSSSPYCDGNTRCPGTSATNVNYNCNLNDDALNCAIGDVSGRIGEIQTNGNSYSNEVEDRISVEPSLLTDRSLLLVCSDANAVDTSGIEKVCTKISSNDLFIVSSDSSITTYSFGTLTFGGVFAIFVVLLLSAGVIFAFYYSSKYPDKTKLVEVYNSSMSNIKVKLGQNSTNNNVAIQHSTYDTAAANKNGGNNNTTITMVHSTSSDNILNNNNTNYNNSAIQVAPSPPPQSTSTAGELPAKPNGTATGATEVNFAKSNSGTKLPNPPPSMRSNDITLQSSNNNDENTFKNMDNNNNYENNEPEREDTPEQPDSDFENVHGALDIEQLGDPQLD